MNKDFIRKCHLIQVWWNIQVMYRYNMYSKFFLKFKFTLTFFFHHKTLRHFYSTSVFYPNECNSCKKQEWGWKKINKKMCPLRVVLLFFHVCFLAQKDKILSQIEQSYFHINTCFSWSVYQLFVKHFKKIRFIKVEEISPQIASV